MISPTLFHLALPVDDMKAAKEFYVDKLGCLPGRENRASLILNFYGHQVVLQQEARKASRPASIYPRHHGLIFLDMAQWETFLGQCRRQQLEFFQPPRLRHQGQLTEHHTFFLIDPANNILEFKCYCHVEAIFGTCGPAAAIGDR